MTMCIEGRDWRLALPQGDGSSSPHGHIEHEEHGGDTKSTKTRKEKNMRRGDLGIE